jgi:hypothetical protein
LPMGFCDSLAYPTRSPCLLGGVRRHIDATMRKDDGTRQGLVSPRRANGREMAGQA